MEKNTYLKLRICDKTATNPDPDLTCLIAKPKLTDDTESRDRERKREGDGGRHC